MKEQYIKPNAEVIDVSFTDEIMGNVLIPSIEIGDGEGDEY